MINKKDLEIIPLQFTDMFKYKVSMREGVTRGKKSPYLSSFVAVDKTWKRHVKTTDYFDVRKKGDPAYRQWSPYGNRYRRREYRYDMPYGLILRMIVVEFDKSFPIIESMNIYTKTDKTFSETRLMMKTKAIEKFYDGYIVWEWHTKEQRVKLNYVTLYIRDDTLHKDNWLNIADIIPMLNRRKQKGSGVAYLYDSLIWQCEHMTDKKLSKQLMKQLWLSKEG